MIDRLADEDQDATQPIQRGTLPELERFNPRIRIIGVPVAELPEPAPAPQNPVSVRAIMDVGPASVVEEEEEAPPTQPPAIQEPPTTRRPPKACDSGIEPVSRSATDSDSGIRRANESSRGGVVTSAPELELARLDWDERENLTDRMEMPDEAVLRWDDDEVTMPRRSEELRAQAKAIATVNEVRRLTMERRGRGPNGTLVDAGTDTLVDTEPPSEIARTSEPESAIESAPAEEIEDAPNTQPSTPPPVRSFAAKSIEIDLADLDTNSLPSLLDEDGMDDVTPAPRALRTPSVAPEQQPAPSESFPPVAVEDVPTPSTRVSPPARRNRGGWYALSAVLTLCLGVVAFVLYPKSGSLDVRLDTPEGTAVAKAEIFVDGQKRCDTDPCILTDVAPGSHVVKVVAEGREVAEATVEVTAQEKARLTVKLPALPAEVEQDAPAQNDAAPEERGVRIDVATDGARVVLVQGESTKVLHGPWPRTIELEPGKYKVVASRYGFAPFVQRITVEEGLTKVHVELERSSASAPKREAAPQPAAAPAPVEPPAAAPPASPSDDDIYE